MMNFSIEGLLLLMKMKNMGKDEEKQKKIGVSGSPLHRMVLQSNG